MPSIRRSGDIEADSVGDVLEGGGEVAGDEFGDDAVGVVKKTGNTNVKTHTHNNAIRQTEDRTTMSTAKAGLSFMVNFLLIADNIFRFYLTPMFIVRIDF